METEYRTFEFETAKIVGHGGGWHVEIPLRPLVQLEMFVDSGPEWFHDTGNWRGIQRPHIQHVSVEALNDDVLFTIYGQSPNDPEPEWCGCGR